MKSINVNFKKISEITFSEVLNYYCVYVIWDSQANKRATYIGYSKNLGTRMPNHFKWLAKPIDGYVAFFETKDEALFVESLLIDTGKELNRLQDHNEVGSSFKVWDKFYSQHGKLKIYIRGHNPFSHPANSYFRDKRLHTIEVFEDYYVDTFRSLKQSA